MTIKTKILFVCYGNICRSPTAQGVFEHLVKKNGLTEKFHIDSAGTSAYHVNHAPDPRSQEAALKRGYDLSQQKARKVDFSDFYEFDHILAMDESNFDALKNFAPKDLHHKIKLMLSYGTSDTTEVPDPYYDGEQGFEEVLDLLEDACDGLLSEIKEHFNI